MQEIFCQISAEHIKIILFVWIQGKPYNVFRNVQAWQDKWLDKILLYVRNILLVFRKEFDYNKIRKERKFR